MNIKARISNKGYSMSVNDKVYNVVYPPGWSSFRSRKHLVDNIIYGRAAPFGMISKELFFSTSQPVLKDFIDKGIKEDIPRVADEEKKDTQSLMDMFNKSAVSFEDGSESPAEYPGSAELDDYKAVLGMSFGKDSLLSLGLAKELGMEVSPVFFGDMIDYNPAEYRIKRDLIRKFDDRFNMQTMIIDDNTDSVFYDKSIPGNMNEMDGTNALLLFTLELLPIAASKNAKYIIFGNEQNHNDPYTNDDGFKAFPSSDQRSEYMKGINDSLSTFTANRQISLVEPIYNLMEMSMLSGRYREYAPFLMSCSSKKLEKSRWCSKCPMCAKFYLFASAAGMDLRQMGFVENMFKKENMHLFPVFNKSPDRPYEKPKESRQEQLLAFYMAYKKGSKGQLIDLFKEQYLDEAREHKEEFYKRFFGVHEPMSLPPKIMSSLRSIFKEETPELP